MREFGDINSRYRAVLKILNAQQRALAEAGATREVLDAYRAVVRYLSGMSHDEVRRILHPNLLKHRESQTADTMSLLEASKLSLEQIERIMADEKTLRKTLEAIAIGRFQVPRGSMRSFANIDMLREKVTTLVHNERAHQTIGSMVRRPRSR